jgi:hypothetical protein
MQSSCNHNRLEQRAVAARETLRALQAQVEEERVAAAELETLLAAVRGQLLEQR